MKDFNSYVKNGKCGRQESNANENCGTGGMNADAMQMLRELASKYEGASQAQLVQAILAEAKTAKMQGRLTDGEIDNFVNSISPMLDSKQRKQLEKVVEKIKG